VLIPRFDPSLFHWILLFFAEDLYINYSCVRCFKEFGDFNFLYDDDDDNDDDNNADFI
jgi:hypothetical protein